MLMRREGEVGGPEGGFGWWKYWSEADCGEGECILVLVWNQVIQEDVVNYVFFIVCVTM